MPANLLGRVPSQELRVVLGERVGQTGQYGGASDDPNNFYLPLWGDSCQVVLTYDGAEIIGLERGPALSVEEWERLNEELENSLVRGPQTLGRDFSFNGHRVLGWWRGAQSGVQILPPPANTPAAPVEIADHPFILAPKGHRARAGGSHASRDGRREHGQRHLGRPNSVPREEWGARQEDDGP